MFSPFQTCWDRVDRAEFHRQSLIGIWNGLDTQNVYASGGHVNDDGTGKFFIRTVQRDWLLPFSLQFGEMLYQLRSALDSCVYDAAIIEFGGADPPPDKEKWEFVFGGEPTKFDEAMRRMKKIIPDELRGLIESVQPYKGVTGGHEGKAWNVGEALVILNNWARLDRHRKLHLVGTAAVAGNLRMVLPKGMSVEYCNFTMGANLLEYDQELASFKIRDFIPGTKIHMNPQFTFDIAVDEIPRVRLEEISLAMFLSVQIVRERFEGHYWIKR